MAVFGTTRGLRPGDRGDERDACGTSRSSAFGYAADNLSGVSAPGGHSSARPVAAIHVAGEMFTDRGDCRTNSALDWTHVSLW